MMEPVRTGLRQLMQRPAARPASPKKPWCSAWPLVCGKEVAARTQAASFSDGTC